MPEGDTIYRTASALRAALLGAPLREFEAARLSGLLPGPGAVVERVDSHGKHLEIGFDDGVVLHTHMRMTGSWHLYRPGEQWRKARGQARVVVTTECWIAVCFNAPVVETYRARGFNRHPGLGSLGPDLCKVGVDLAECVARIDRFVEPDRTVAEVLLDQRIACGVGNVYKSEVLWACGVHPLTPISAVGPAVRLALIDTASRLLQANLGNVERVTVPGAPGGQAVYGRFAKPCLRCHTPIEVRRHGEQARVTYWCPGCQIRLDQAHRPAPVGDVVKLDPQEEARLFLERRRPRGPHLNWPVSHERRADRREAHERHAVPFRAADAREPTLTTIESVATPKAGSTTLAGSTPKAGSTTTTPAPAPAPTPARANRSVNHVVVDPVLARFA